MRGRIREERAQEIFDSLKIFENQIGIAEIYGGNLDKLSKLYTDKQFFHFRKNSSIETTQSLEKAFNTLKGLMSGQNTRKIYAEEIVRAPQHDNATRETTRSAEEVKEEEKRAWDFYNNGMQKTAERVERRAERTDDSGERAAQALGQAMQTMERQVGSSKRELPSRSSYAKSSLKVAGDLLANEYFDLVLMLIGIVGGIYLTISYSSIIGLPLLAGGIIVGFLPGGDGKSLFSKFFDAVLKPATTITLGGGIRAAIILMVGIVLANSATSYLRITDFGFDAVQFGIVAFVNTVILAYLWTGVLEKEKEEVTVRAPKVGAETAKPAEHVNINAPAVSAEAPDHVVVRPPAPNAEQIAKEEANVFAPQIKKSMEDQEKELQETRRDLEDARKKLKEKEDQLKHDEEHFERVNE
jgi:hypothetical protein